MNELRAVLGNPLAVNAMRSLGTAGRPTALESAASIIGKLIWLSLTLWAFTGGQPAKAVFAFCCDASVLAIACGLQDGR